MYPTTVREFEGSVRPSPISIVREQIGPSIHFLYMEIIQLIPGVCGVKAVVTTVGGLLASRRVFCWLPFGFFVPIRQTQKIAPLSTRE